MSHPTHFDVLVIYSSRSATSASVNKKSNLAPFALTGNRAHYNPGYSYLLENCAKNNLKAAFTTLNDVIGPGLCISYWLYQDDNWIKVNKPGYSKFIFDKFSTKSVATTAKRRLLFSDPQIQSFNHDRMIALFFDKLHTYDQLSTVSIPTVGVSDSHPESVQTAFSELATLIANHPHSQDFSDGMVLKDRYGSGGVNIFKITAGDQQSISRILDQKPAKSFILQPFTQFDQGYRHNQILCSADIRLIFLGGVIIQSYVRLAKTGDFRCNEHQGGTILALNLEDIPLPIKKMASTIVSSLDKAQDLFALDFMISNLGNIYLIEGNNNPGIYWGKDEIDKQMTKSLIRKIVREFSRRTAINAK